MNGVVLIVETAGHNLIKMMLTQAPVIIARRINYETLND